LGIKSNSSNLNLNLDDTIFLALFVICEHSSINAPVYSVEPNVSNSGSLGYKNKSLRYISLPLLKVIILPI